MMAIVNGTAERDTLNGTQEADFIDAGDGPDLVYGNGGNDEITGGGGNDELYGDATFPGGSDGADMIDGGDGNDTIRGGGGNDDLRGGSGNDFIYGGSGADTIDGGDGDDFLDGFGEYGYATDDSPDTIFGGTGNDRISIEYGDSADGGSGINTLTINYYASPVGITADFLAVAGGATIQIGAATIRNFAYVNYINLTPYDDDVVAGPGSGLQGVSIYGYAGNDRLVGSSGRDFIDAGEGNDIVYAGIGRDAGVSPSVDQVFGGGGDDTIYGGVDGMLAFGDGGNDRLFGGAGVDELRGGTGDDLIVGGGGDDALVGDAGADTFLYDTRGFGRDQISDLGADDRIDVSALGISSLDDLREFIVQSSTQYQANNSAIELGYDGKVERILILGQLPAAISPVNFLFATSAAARTVTGSGGADVLFGGVGDDTFSAGGGDDVLVGSAGADLLDGGDGSDLASYAASTAAVVIDLALGTASGGSAAGDSFVSVEGLRGSAFADTLTGNGADNRLEGGNGDDILAGGGGADVLVGGSGNDRLTGGEGADRFVFSARGFGADTITDFAAGDLLDLSALNIPDFGALRPYIREVAGAATISLFFNGQAETITLAGRTASELSAADFVFDTSTDGRFIEGSAGADLLFGNAGYDILLGRDGADVLIASAGQDSLSGGNGNDLFLGTASQFDGDTIEFFAAGDRITITDASIEAFSFQFFFDTLYYTGGALKFYQPATRTFVATANAAGGVDLTIGTPPPPAPLSTARDDFSGDGRSDILWRNVDGTLSDWLGKANGGFTTNDANALTQVSTDWQVAGTGDFNGDGRTDILWRNADGRFSNWLGQANGGFVSNDANAFTQVGTDWQVAGTGDFNGDGRADVLWRNADGRLSDWLGQANGGFVSNDANALAKVGTDWQVAGTGDFNGDGRADILWRNADGRMSDWLGQTNGGFVSNDNNAFAQVGTDWRIVGTGDFNGDGRDDILWRNADGRLSDWLGQANGGFVGNDANALTPVPTSWSVVATGDYNGDGRDDILWRNADGALSDWLGQANGGFVSNDANAFAQVPTSWQVQSGDHPFG